MARGGGGIPQVCSRMVKKEVLAMANWYKRETV